MAKRRNLRKEKAERNKIYARKFRKVSRRRFSGRGRGRPGMGQGSNQSENSENSEQSGQSSQSNQSSQNTYNS